MKSLDEIAIACETDRASVFTRTYGKPHDYARHYDKLFSNLREQPVNLLEIGVGGGEGVRMWLQYFQKGNVHGVDIVTGTNDWDGGHPGDGPDARYTFHHGDQQESGFWKTFNEGPFGTWDIIVDDGLHSNISVITTFNALWQHLKPGGFYAIEDLNVAYGGPSFFVSPSWPNQIEFIKGKVDELNMGSGIDSIYMAKELCVLRKSLS